MGFGCALPAASTSCDANENDGPSPQRHRPAHLFLPWLQMYVAVSGVRVPAQGGGLYAGPVLDLLHVQVLQSPGQARDEQAYAGGG